MAAGIAAARWMPNDFYGAVSEIVTVLGFIMAALVPAIALAATALREGGFSVRRIRDLGAALRRQMEVFGGLFLYALAACILLVAGKIASWTLSAFFGFGGAPVDVGLGPVFPGLLTFLLVFLALRSFAFVSGMASLLGLTVSMAEDEARERDRRTDAKVDGDLEGYRLPADYGREIAD